MKFHPNKCSILRVVTGKRMTVVLTTYTLHGQIWNTEHSSKYFGVTLTDDLSWTHHVATVAARGNRLVGFLRRNFRDCTTTKVR